MFQSQMFKVVFLDSNKVVRWYLRIQDFQERFSIAKNVNLFRELFQL